MQQIVPYGDALEIGMNIYVGRVLSDTHSMTFQVMTPVDAENLEGIYSYFKNSDTDNLDIAMNELGADYSEEEVRLVRVKFISEMAN